MSTSRRHHPVCLGAGAALAWAVVAGCGRIGYDPLASELPDAGHGPVQDAGSPADGSQGEAMVATADAGEDASDSAFDADAGAAPDAADAAVEACAVSSVTDYCTSLPPLPSPPVIDGILDCGPALLAMPAVGWTGPSPLPAFPPGNSTEIAAAWRPDGLYVFLSVTTPAAFPADPASPVFYGAGIELFVDDDAVYASPPAYDNPGTIQFIVTAPVSALAVLAGNPDASAPDASSPDSGSPDVFAPDAAPGPWRAEGFRNAADQGPWASTQLVMLPSSGGFVFEGFVAARDLGLASWSLAAGQHVGFDVAVDVSYTSPTTTGPQGHRVGQYFLHIAPPPSDAGSDAGPTIGYPFADPRAFCAPTLGSM